MSTKKYDMSTKRLLKEFKAMRLEVDAKNGLDAESQLARRILALASDTYRVQRQYELMHADNPDATCKKITDDELDNLKEMDEINCSIGKRLGAIKKAKRNTSKK